MTGYLRAVMGLIILTALAGCAPQLAKVPYTELEQQWIDYLDKSYPCWTPPQTIPPVASGDENEKASEVKTENTSKEVVPPEANIPALPPVQPVAAAEDTSAPADKPASVDKAKSEMDKAKSDEIEEIAQPKLEEKYTVQKGDTLWRIAKKFYKDGKKWHLIYEFNKDVIHNPNVVPAGIEIKIPPLN